MCMERWLAGRRAERRPAACAADVLEVIYGMQVRGVAA